MGGVGQRIKELRKAQKLTQQELAEGVVTRSYISQIEKGLIQPSYDTLEKLSRRLDCTVEDFFKEPENMALVVAEWKKYIRIAEGQVESGNFDQAKRTLDNSNIASNTELNDYDLGILAWVRGKLCLNHDENEEAANYFEKSLSHLESFMYAKEHIRSLNSLAYSYMQMEQSEQALQRLDEAYSMLQTHQIGGLVRISVLVNSGVVRARLGEYYSAMRFFHEADEVNQALKTSYKMGHIFMGLGICLMQLHKYDEAIELYRRAVDYYQYIQDADNKAGTLTNLGILYRKRGMWEQAADVFTQSIALYEALQKESMAINAKMEMARAFYHGMQYEKAAEIASEVIQADHQAQVHRGGAYEILGELAYKRGEFQLAVQHFSEAYNLFQQAKSKTEANNILTRIAESHLALGNFEKSARCYQQMTHSRGELLNV